MQIINDTKREAFTLIEIILVIVILGIVSMIGADIIAHMYEGYTRSKIVNELTQKTELSIEQIAKRLQYRIKNTTFARDKNNPNTIKPLSSDDLNETFNMIEWIGYDNEGFLGDYNGSVNVPGWSGFVDLNNANTDKTQIVTPGSHLSYAKSTINALSYNDIDISAPTPGKGPAIVFKCWNSVEPKMYGFDYTHPNDHNNTLRVKSVGEDVLQFTENLNSKELCEQYYLAWSAYALVPEGNDANDFNLTLYYNYQPWYGEKYSDPGTKHSVVAEHVSTFRFIKVGNTVRIKLCIQDGNQTGTSVGICKEKAVF